MEGYIMLDHMVNSFLLSWKYILATFATGCCILIGIYCLCYFQR